MIASSKLSFNEEYYAQYYSDWVRTRSRFRKFALPLGVLLVVVGFVLLTQFEGHRYLGIVVIGFGIFHLIDALTYRSRWIKKRLSAGGSKAGQSNSTMIVSIFTLTAQKVIFCFRDSSNSPPATTEFS